MTSGTTAWIDGEFIDLNRATVPLLSHSFSRGSAVFEVTAITPTVSGPAFFCLEEHLERFFSSARQTYMDLPIERETLVEVLRELALRNSVSGGIAKCYAYYPGIELGTSPSGGVSVAAFCLDYSSFALTSPCAPGPVSVCISSYRKIHPQTTAVHAKVAGNYANGYLARMESRQRGFDEALMLDARGFVAEGPAANIFFVKGTAVETPTDENVLPGITRGVIMQVLEDMGRPARQVDIRPGDIQRYDEAFFSGTTSPVMPIRRIEDREFICPGPLTRALSSRMADVLGGRVPGYEKHLTLIRR
ncbi:MAG: aminotransferase class IV [Desulfomonilia bacterium]